MKLIGFMGMVAALLLPALTARASDAVRRGRAESDVVVGEIMNKPVSLDAALRERATEIASGTISVEFETDPTGNVRRRTKVTKLEIKGRMAGQRRRQSQRRWSGDDSFPRGD